MLVVKCSLTGISREEWQERQERQRGLADRDSHRSNPLYALLARYKYTSFKEDQPIQRLWPRHPRWRPAAIHKLGLRTFYVEPGADVGPISIDRGLLSNQWLEDHHLKQFMGELPDTLIVSALGTRHSMEALLAK